MFKFNFSIKNNEDCESSSASPIETNLTQKTLDGHDCEEIQIDEDKINNLDEYRKFIKNDFEINYICSINLKEIQKVSTNDIVKADINHSDLLPGVYEGGAKVWECTEDLLEYFLENTAPDYFENKSVLDLGCGVGLLGIFALKRGAKGVCFQDYNKDVIENITIPNVLLNTQNPHFNSLKHCKFYSGDWMKFLKFTENEEKFELIVTSETIYNPQNYRELLDIFENKLKQNGIIFLAGKTYYFGVGGGLRQFEELIYGDKRFKSKIVWNSINGVSREILQIQRTENLDS